MSTENDSHQHPTALEYRPALPIPNSKLCMWLFISTEIMFFSALIGSYFIFRLGAPAGSWPSAADVHVSLWIGVLNTIVLMCSSVTMLVSLRATQRNRPGLAKTSLILTIALGSVFLGVKGWEWAEKYRLGIHPWPNAKIHDQADVYYLAAVRKSVNEQIDELERRRDAAADVDNALVERLELLYRLQRGWVDATLRTVSTTNNRLIQQAAISAVADQVYPAAKLSADTRAYLSTDRQALQVTIRRLTPLLQQIEAEAENTQQQLNAVDEKIKAVGRPPADNTSDQVESKGGSELGDQRNQLAAQLDDINQRATDVRKKLMPLAERRDALDVLEPATDGINHYFGLTLPVVIPNGRMWASTYFLLTGFHALHVAAGIAVMLIVCFFRLGVRRSNLMENCTLYWHFVDVVWLFLFALIYLL